MTYPLDFWGYVRERELIRERRAAGLAPSWTDDPVLKTHSFTNVRREDDPDTRKSIELVAEATVTPLDFLWRTYCFRALNRVETFAKYGLPYPDEFVYWEAQIDAAMKRGESVGARQHLTFWSHAKIALRRIDSELAARVHQARTGIDAIVVLASAPATIYVGPYLGTLIVGDLALSRWGGKFGPDTEVPVANGARVGLEIFRGALPSEAHLLFDEHGSASRKARSLREGMRPELIDAVRELARSSEEQAGFALTFMDVENSLCEYSRYARIAAGVDGHWRRRIRR